MAPPRKRRLVAVNDLKWKSVALPERMDDAEGFYGLEEIDDVEVSRDPSSNSLSFHAVTANDSAASDAESEWQGFDDSQDDKENDQQGTESVPDPNEKPVKKKDKKKKKQSSQVSNSETESKAIASKPNGFQHLESEDKDDDGVDISEWNNLDLSADVLTALSRLRFSTPTPIQAASIPQAESGHDVIGKASTGSGKTLAYGIPIIERFLSREEQATKSPTALILAPTRELAHQISKHLGELSSKLPSQSPRFATITGGLSVYKQQRLLKDADVVIGTPGRLWEVINSEAGLLTALRQISFLVVDEADRLLSDGHFKEVEEILKSLDRTDVDGEDLNRDLAKPKRQTLVFSATFQKGLQRKLAGKGKQSDTSIMSKQESMRYLLEKLNFREDTPKYIDVNPVSQMADNLKEGLVECAANEKDLYLYALLLHHPKARTLIFTNSISAVRRVVPFLQNLNLQVHGLHSQMPQKARLRAVERFTAQNGSILVATDVAARGLDIPQVELVLHYHVPRQADVYVHRSGRTARAESAGSSILLCAPDEVVPVRRLVAKIHAQNAGQTSGTRFFIRTVDLDRQVVQRLKGRANLSKKIADTGLAKEKHRSEDNWLKKAAEDLGVEYDSEEFSKGEKGRGRKRREKESEARTMGKQEVASLRAQLKELLAQRVNVGVSERYLTAGGVDVDQLLGSQGEHQGPWLGQVDLLNTAS